MKIKSIVSICKREKRFCLFDDERMESAVQWLGDGSAVYPLLKMPPLDKESIFAVFDIPDKQASKMFVRQEPLPVSIALPESAVLHYGAVLGTVELVDCVPVEALIGKLSERERVLGDYTPGRFAWVLKNPVIFDRPIPARGFQGWWNWAGEHCRECRCVSCDLFQTAGCLEGKNVCGKCNHESHTGYCPWHPDEQ